VQEVTGDAVAVAFVDQEYTGEQAAEATQAQHMPGPRAFAVRHAMMSGWQRRLRASHFVAFAILMLKRFVALLLQNA
jgi:hypothetical protein